MRRVELEEFGTSILSDTVGFIRDLPHSLVQAFHSTLEEVSNAQLLLHVVDVVSHFREQCINEVNKVLQDIDAAEIPTIMVYNKIDLGDHQPRIKKNADGMTIAVWVSAQSGEGIDLLLNAIAEHLSRLHLSFAVVLPASNGKLRAALYEKNLVRQEAISDSGEFELDLELSPADIGWLKKQDNIQSITPM